MARISKVTPTGNDGKEAAIGHLVKIEKDGRDMVKLRYSLGYVMLTNQDVSRIAAWMLQRGDG